MQWRAIRFPLPEGTDSVILTLVERGDAWGQWFGIGTPRAEKVESLGAHEPKMNP